MAIAAPLILIVDDEAPVRSVLVAALHTAGYRTIEAATLQSGLAHALGHRPELILLDLGLPDGPGLDLVTTLRPAIRTPVIVLSARGEDRAKVAALDAGADDYLTKPFSVEELLARIRVALRHAGAPIDGERGLQFAAGGLHVDPVRRVVSRDGEPIHLTPTEYKLLLALVRQAGRVATHRSLLTEVWGQSAAAHPHYLRVYMAQLRNKLEDDPSNPVLLLTEPGVGYRMIENAS